MSFQPLRTSFGFAFVILLMTSSLCVKADEVKKPLRAGIIGCDTSHVQHFTDIINGRAEQGKSGEHGGTPGLKVVAAYPGGSPDLPASIDRVPQFTQALKERGVQIVDSIDALLPLVDVVMLESVDGRPHLEQVQPVLAAKKPVFIDKPLAGSLADAVEIFRLAEANQVPCFTASSLRFSPAVVEVKNNPRFKKVLGCSVHAPCKIEPHHPDLFWYGIHGVEMLFTMMGTGCESVSRTHTEGVDLVVGIWDGGRVGTFRGIRDGRQDYGMTVYGPRDNIAVEVKPDYKSLVEEVTQFFSTHKPPVSAAESLEIFAFMEAADESKRRGGTPVKLSEVLDLAKKKPIR